MEKEKFWSIPLEEQETTISFSRVDKRIDIWTNGRTMITKLDNLCKSCPSMYVSRSVGKNAQGEVMDKQYYLLDKSLLSFRKVKVKYDLTDEQKAKRAEQLRRNIGK